MKFEWTEETIRFREDAAVRVQFDAAIAQHILPFLPENAHVCDAGCGLGFLSLALAPHCRRITAVDASSAALAVLARNAVRMGYDNIQIVQGDLFAQRWYSAFSGTRRKRSKRCARSARGAPSL